MLVKPGRQRLLLGYGCSAARSDGQRLAQEETQIAVYAFDSAIDLEIALTAEYEGARDTSWEGIVTRLELERARVRGRIGGPALR